MSSQFIFVIALLLMVASSSVVQGEKLLVTSGYQTFGFFKETQIIDLDYDSQVCQDGIPYPLEVYGAVGGLVGEKPVVCGGLPLPENSDTDCYILDEKWTRIPAISGRYHAASVQVGSDMWITGGNPGPNPPTKSTEIILEDGLVVLDGLDLPMPLTGHCIVAINSTTVMLIGGFDGDNFRTDTYYLELKIGGSMWSKGPDLRIARDTHTCGIIRNTETNEEYLAVAGGSTSSTTLDSVEMLSLKTGKEFFEGPRMPNSLARHNMVEYKDSLLAIGGYDGGYYSSAIYELTCGSMCSWSTKSQSLKYPMAGMVSIIVSDELCIV